MKLCRVLSCAMLSLAILSVQMVPAMAETTTETSARNAIIMDYESGRVLFAKAADDHIPTASMSKLMTIYQVFDALKNGKLSMDDMLSVSQKAWKMGGSRMYLDLGTQAKVSDLIRGVIIQSGNDAAVVLAEALGGDEASFAKMLNDTAARLEMKDSHFMDASGWPDPNHYSSAHDLAVLGRHLIKDFPEYYPIFAEKEFAYNNIKQGNRNPLLYRDIGVDGLKTGHTEEAGFCLVASSVRHGQRIIMVVTGLKSMQQRADEPSRLLDWAYANFDQYDIAKQGTTLGDVAVWLGDRPNVPAGIKQDVSITLSSEERRGLKTYLDVKEPVAAPITVGQQLGDLVVEAPGMQTMRYPVVALEPAGELGFWGRVHAGIQTMLIGESNSVPTQTAQMPAQ